MEKVLKAVIVARTGKQPPMTHRLTHLAEVAGLELNEQRIDLLETITDFNLEARYPDERFSFRKRCTRRFTEMHLKNIKELRRWLQEQVG